MLGAGGFSIAWLGGKRAELRLKTAVRDAAVERRGAKSLWRQE